MSVFAFDTDMLSLWQRGHEAVTRHVAEHTNDELVITIFTVQEQFDGWHSRLPRAKDRKEIADLYRRLADTVRFLARVNILEFSEAAIDRYEALRTQKLNIGKMDLRIAAIVLECGATLVTRNAQDFSRVQGLKTEDWAKQARAPAVVDSRGRGTYEVVCES